MKWFLVNMGPRTSSRSQILQRASGQDVRRNCQLRGAAEAMVVFIQVNIGIPSNQAKLEEGAASSATRLWGRQQELDLSHKLKTLLDIHKRRDLYTLLP